MEQVEKDKVEPGELAEKNELQTDLDDNKFVLKSEASFSQTLAT
ncbi:hypothetical protein [Fischerella sp. PCC 9605]|nr:hypothetical protein [Fischerella sp. PCC 9605]